MPQDSSMHLRGLMCYLQVELDVHRKKRMIMSAKEKLLRDYVLKNTDAMYVPSYVLSRSTSKTDIDDVLIDAFLNLPTDITTHRRFATSIHMFHSLYWTHTFETKKRRRHELNDLSFVYHTDDGLDDSLDANDTFDTVSRSTPYLSSTPTTHLSRNSSSNSVSNSVSRSELEAVEALSRLRE